MTTAPHPLLSTPHAAGGEFSATLLRLRAVGLEVARRRLATLDRARRAAAPRRRSRWAAMRWTVRSPAALIWVALAMALTLGYGFWAATTPVAHNLSTLVGRAR